MTKKDNREWAKREFELISNNIKNKDSLSPYDFLKIRNFKLQNFSTATPEEIERITKEAFILAKEDRIKEAVLKLKENLHGVGFPIASAILAMKYRDKYAIIDRIILMGLNKKDWVKKYQISPQVYEDYLLLMRKLAKERNIELREFELKLFEKDKETLEWVKDKLYKKD